MKVLLIGAGGIGSRLVDFIQMAYDCDQIPADVEINVADGDSVEVKNIRIQNFLKTDIAENKAVALAGRYPFICSAFGKNIIDEAELKGYDLFILAADNVAVRKLVMAYCHKTANTNFIDLRAFGRRYFCMPCKGLWYSQDIASLDLNDTGSGGCQRPEDEGTGRKHFGFLVAASMGIQMLLNHIRGEVKKDWIQGGA